MRFEITAPATDFTGVVAGVAFANGKATVEVTTPELRRAVQYFRRQGYGVVDLDKPAAPEETVTDKPPVRSATKAEWKAYAIGHGVDEAEAEKLNRDELAEKFLGKKEG